MRDFLCFEQHLRQARANRYLFTGGERGDPAKIEIPKVWYEQPIYYKCNRFSVVGTGEDVIWPLDCKMLDYELEFGIILGKGGKNIAQGQGARAHLRLPASSTTSARATSRCARCRASSGPTKGKDFDTGNILGPWLVTADEVPRPVQSHHGGAGERRGMVARQFRHHASQVRGHDRARVGGRDAASRASSSAPARSATAAGWSRGASSSRTTWSSWRSTGSACCATGW